MTDANDSSQLQTGALLWCGGIPVVTFQYKAFTVSKRTTHLLIFAPENVCACVCICTQL